MELGFAICTALGIFVGNTVCQHFILKQTWKDAILIGLLAGIIVFAGSYLLYSLT